MEGSDPCEPVLWKPFDIYFLDREKDYAYPVNYNGNIPYRYLLEIDAYALSSITKKNTRPQYKDILILLAPYSIVNSITFMLHLRICIPLI